MRNSIIFILFMGILTSCGQQEHSRRAPEKKAPDIEQPCSSPTNKAKSGAIVIGRKK